MSKRPRQALLFLTLPTVVAAILVFVLMQYRIPTNVEVDLTVNRAVFAVGGADFTQVLNAVRFESITVQKFSRIKLSPANLEVADPAQYSYSDERYAESAWKSLELSPPVVVVGEDEMLQPAFTLETSTSDHSAAGTLDYIWVNPGSEVALEVIGARNTVLAIKVREHESSAVMSLHHPFRFMIDYCRVNGIMKLAYEADSLTFRGQLPDHSPAIEVTGQPRSLDIFLTIPPESATDLFPEKGIPVAALDFTQQYPQGLRGTTLVKAGGITYPGYPKIEKVLFDASDFIGLSRLDGFRIQRLELDPEHKGIHFNLRGVAGHVRTGSPESSKDHRLTVFDTLSHNPQLMIVFSIVLWVFPTTVGAYRLYRELSK